MTYREPASYDSATTYVEAGANEDQLRINPDAADAQLALFNDGVPDHAHWISADTTSTSGTWVPRSSKWKALLDSDLTEAELDTSTMNAIDAFKARKFQRTLEKVRTVRLTPERESFSLASVPLGTWKGTCPDALTLEAELT